MDGKTPWSEELNAEELPGASSLVASTICSRENPFFSAQHSSSSIEKCGMMLVLKGVMFFARLLI